jgi:hypothetical protein
MANSATRLCGLIGEGQKGKIFGWAADGKPGGVCGMKREKGWSVRLIDCQGRMVEGGGVWICGWGQGLGIKYIFMHNGRARGNMR